MDKENCPRATSAAAACIKRIWDVSWAHAIDRCYARSAIVFASGSIEASDCENSRDKELTAWSLGRRQKSLSRPRISYCSRQFLLFVYHFLDLQLCHGQRFNRDE